MQGPSVTPDSTDRTDRVLVALITLAAAWLRFLHMEQPSLWWDEFITVGASLRPLPDMLAVLQSIGPSDIGVELFPPLAHVLTHLLAAVAKSDVLMRLPGLLAGVAAVPAVYMLCRKPLGRLSALLAALMLAVSVYHLHFSREVRPYSLFMLENLLALHVLYTALTEGRRRLLWWYGALAAAMLYTSYMAATLIFAQVTAAAVILFWRLREDRREALALAWTLFLALALAGAAYLPWAQGQLNVFALLRDPTFTPKFNLDFVASSLKEFAAFAYRGEIPMGWAFAALGLAGCACALRSGRIWFVLLLSLWVLMPIAGIFLAKARMELSSRYIFSLFLFLNIFAAHALALAVEWVSDRLFGTERPIFAARLTVSTLLLLLLASPNLTSLSEYYSRETSHYKELVDYLAENRNNQDLILYFNPRNLKLVFDWYGQGLIPTARELPLSGYHRAFLLAPDSTKAQDKFPLAVRRAHLEDVDILSFGLARTPVCPMTADAQGRYVHEENFSGFSMLEDAFRASNMVPSPLTKTLTRHDAGLPGWAEYRFQPQPGSEITGATLTATFSVILAPGITTDDRAALILSVDGKEPRKLAEVSMDSFRQPDGNLIPANHERKRSVTLSLNLDRDLAGARSFDLRLEQPSATRSGPIELEDFRLEASLAGQQAGREALPLALLEQLPVVPWTPKVDLTLSRALYAFSLDPELSRPGLGSPQAHEAYQRAYPGDKPVRVLAYPDGSPAIALYDPALAHPALRVTPGSQRILEAFPSSRRIIASMKLAGALDKPVLTLDRMEIPLPVTCPAPATLTVNPNGQGELVFTPLYTAAQFDPATLASSENIKRIPDEDCLTCDQDRPCSLTYSMRSEMPVTSLRIRAYPRVYSDAGGKNAVRTLISTDGLSWREVNSYRSTGSGRWEGWKIPQYTRVRLDKPAREVLVRFELAGQKTQLWSAPDALMRFEARLDASALPAPLMDKWPVRLGLRHASPLDVMLLDAPQPFPDHLRRTR